MAEPQKVSSLVTGGSASAGPPLGPALGPLGVNIMEIIKAINEKTKDFEGMKVPVTVSVYPDTKKWEIEIGIPSAAALLLKSYATSLKSVAKTVIGTCSSLGIKVEGKTPKEITAEINAGKWDAKLK